MESRERTAQKFLRIRQVIAVTGLSRPSVYRLAACGAFPKPLKLSERSSAWIEADVAEWMQSRIDAALQGAA